MKKTIIITLIIALLTASAAWASKHVLTKGSYQIKTGSYYIKSD